MQPARAKDSKSWKWRIGLFLLLALGLVVAVVVFMFTAMDYSLRRQLADGSTLRIVDVSFGTDHSYHEAQPKAWQLAMGKKLPYLVAARLGWWFRGGSSIAQGGYGGVTNLLLFFTHEGAGKMRPASRKSYRVIVFDDQGNSFEGEANGEAGGPDSTDTHFHFLNAASFDAYPRRCKTIGVRFLQDQKDGKAGETIAEFHIPNPHPGSFPAWFPEPVPDVKHAGDLSATLMEFTTGLSRDHPEGAARENEESMTRLALHLGDAPNCPWKPMMLEVSDATDNRWLPYSPATRTRENASDYTLTFPGTLWPGEAAWKLRVELSRASGFEPEELWACGMPVSAEGSKMAGAHLSTFQMQTGNVATTSPEHPPGFSTNINGCSIHLETSEAKKARDASQAETLDVSLFMSAETISNDFRLTLVKITDEQGREVKIKSSTEWLREQSSYDLTAPPDTTRLHCTFAYHRSRFVEFVVAPKR